MFTEGLLCLNPVSLGSLSEEEERQGPDMLREGSMTKEAEGRVMGLQAEDCWPPRDSSPGAFRGSTALSTLNKTCCFQAARELSLLLKLPSSQCSVMAAPGRSYGLLPTPAFGEFSGSGTPHSVRQASPSPLFPPEQNKPPEWFLLPGWVLEHQWSSQ